MNELIKNSLQEKAKSLRLEVLEMCYKKGGHISSSFSCVEIFLALFYGIMKKDADGRYIDRFLLSKGHAENVYYCVLANLNFFPADWLFTRYRDGDHLLGGHPSHHIPGVDITTGALGHGLGIGAGIILGNKLQGLVNEKVFVLLGDAECSEGSIWEAALFAGNHKLKNLIAIIDYNKIGASDYIANFCDLEPVIDKWSAFKWEVICVKNGNSLNEVIEGLNFALDSKSDKPKMLVVNTVKGYGCSIFENDPIWHVKKVGMSDYNFARLEILGTSVDE
jgi:transketolase